MISILVTRIPHTQWMLFFCLWHVAIMASGAKAIITCLQSVAWATRRYQMYNKKIYHYICQAWSAIVWLITAPSGNQLVTAWTLTLLRLDFHGKYHGLVTNLGKDRFAMVCNHHSLLTVKHYGCVLKGLLTVLQNIIQIGDAAFKNTPEVARYQAATNCCCHRTSNRVLL